MRFVAVLMLFIGVLAMPAIAPAQTQEAPTQEAQEEIFKQAIDAFDRKDYATMLALLTPLAQQGNPNAQVTVGMVHHDGLGVEVDAQKAVEWYKKAVAQNNPVAQVKLAKCYDEGDGVAQDFAAAAELYKKALENGRIEGALGLARLLEAGKGIEQSYNDAGYLYHQTARAGSGEGALGLAKLLGAGKGLSEPDYERALTWAYVAKDFKAYDGDFIRAMEKQVGKAKSAELEMVAGLIVLDILDGE